MVAGRHAFHRQGHHALPLRLVARDVLRRRHRAAALRVRARLRLHQERRCQRGREDQQIARQRHRADGDHHEILAATRFAITSCANARFPAMANSAGSRFAAVYNSDLGKNLGNLLSRVTTLIVKNFDCVLPGTAGQTPAAIVRRFAGHRAAGAGAHGGVPVQSRARENLAADSRSGQSVRREERAVETGENRTRTRPGRCCSTSAEILRVAAILLKPVLVRSAAAIYRTFNFGQPWDEVRYADTAPRPAAADLRVIAKLDERGKLPPLFPVIT